MIDKRSVILLDSIGTKVRQVDAKDTLIGKLRKHVQELLPFSRENVNSCLQFFRNAIQDSSERFQSIADWMDLMQVPLSFLDLSEEELAGLLKRLENIDFADLVKYDFQSHDLNLFTRTLINSDLKFKTKDTNVLSLIARLCANKNGWLTAAHIKKFDIESLAARVQIAFICAMQNAFGTGLHIQKFNIEDSAIRIQIARLCARQENGFTPYFIKNFEIPDPVTRAEIARLCAKQDVMGTAKHFRNFEILIPAIRANIARVCAKQNGRETAQFIKNFEISNSREQLELFYQCALSNPESLFFMENFSPLPEGFTELAGRIEVLATKEAKILSRTLLFNEIDRWIYKLPISSSCQQILLDSSQKVSLFPPYVQNVVCLWLLASILTMSLMKNDAVEWMLNTGIWSELERFRDPSLRILFTRGLFELSIDEKNRKAWDAFLSSMHRREGGQRSLMLLVIPFSILQNQGIDERRLIEVANALDGYQKKKSTQLRSVYHIKNILHVLQALVSNEVYSLNEKKAGFEKIFGHSDEKIIMKNIIAAKGLMQLKDTEWPTAVEELSVLFRHSLQKIIPMDKKRIRQ